MPALAVLQSWRMSLFEARMRGLRSVRDQNGEELTYTSDREMASAIAACDREINALAGATSSTNVIFRTTKGL